VWLDDEDAEEAAQQSSSSRRALPPPPLPKLKPTQPGHKHTHTDIDRIAIDEMVAAAGFGPRLCSSSLLPSIHRRRPSHYL
jgi:hypothetical protein